jgi:hypothetical protein
MSCEYLFRQINEWLTTPQEIWYSCFGGGGVLGKFTSVDAHVHVTLERHTFVDDRCVYYNKTITMGQFEEKMYDGFCDIWEVARTSMLKYHESKHSVLLGNCLEH